MNPPLQDTQSTAAGGELAMSFRLHLFEHGTLKSVEFFDARQFEDAKACAIAAVESREADDAELHDDSAGLLFCYTQLLS